MKGLVLAASSVAAAMGFAGPATARDQIWIVGSGTIQPFTMAVAQRAAKAAGAPAPVVEETGTTLALEYICTGTGPGFPNAASVTRRMRRSELDTCRRNGVAEIVEIPVGLDILVVAQSKVGPPMWLTLPQMFLALARDVPGGDGALIANPYRKWSEIDLRLPDVAIELRIPPQGSGTREALQDLFLHKGAERIPALARLMAANDTLKSTLRTMRSDRGVVVEESPGAIARALADNPNAVGVFGYRYLQANRATLKGVTIEGADANEEEAYGGRYPGTRTIYIYVRKAELPAVPGLDRLGAEYVSSAALGPDGYLIEKGFVPLPADAMIRTMTLVRILPPLRREMLPE